MEITRTTTSTAMIPDFHREVAEFCIQHGIAVEVYYTDTVIEFHPEWEIRVRLCLPVPPDMENPSPLLVTLRAFLSALDNQFPRYEIKGDDETEAERWYIDTDDDNVDDLATEMTDKIEADFPGLQISYKGWD